MSGNKPRVESPLNREISRRGLIKAGIVAGAGAALASLPLTGCRPSSTTDKDHIRFSWYEDANTLDPTMTTMTPTIVMLRPCMFNALVRQTPEGTIVPDLAESWRMVDPLTWEFKLRKGVRFHNGEPFNAEAVQFTFGRLKDPERASIQAFLWGPVETTKIIDEYTVQIITNQPNGPLLRNLAIGAMLPPKGYNQEAFATQPIGTGPFKFVEWVRGERTVMEANPDYWGGPPKLKKITYYPIAEEATRIAGLRKGDLDIIFTVPIDQVKPLEGETKIKLERILSCDTHVVAVGGKMRDDFVDHRLRLAVAYAIDRRQLIDKILLGYGEMPGSVISPMVFGFNPNLGPHPYDPEKAKALMKEAGKGDGMETEFQYGHGILPKIGDLSMAIVSDLKKVGINARVTVHPDMPTFGTFQNPGNFDLLFSSWTSYTLDADMCLFRNWHSSVGREGTSRYEYHKELDTLLEQGRHSLDDKVRLEAYYKAQEIMRTFPTRVPLYHAVDIWGVRSEVQGFKPTASRILDFHQVSKS